MPPDPTPIDCDDAVLLVAAGDERALTDDERARLDAHLEGCERCRTATVTSDGGDDRGADDMPPPLPIYRNDPAEAADDGDDDLRALPVIDPALYAWAETIGRGGMGRVMAARDRRLGRRVAIKELIARGLEERFETEARITARLEHPAIVHVHEAGRWPSGELFYAMKLVEGAPLSVLIRERPTLAARIELVPNVMAVVDAIAYAHSQGVIHRDLKPSNIVVGPFGETVVIDWGLAKDLSEIGEAASGSYRTASDGATEAGLGTPQYMPPEQARGEVPDRRVDVYALGATLYHVLAGAPPYGDARPGDVLTRIHEKGPPPIGVVAPGVPPDLAAIVAKAMARDRADRYADADALAADLRRFQAGQLVSASAYSPWTLVRRWIGRHRAMVTAAAVVLAVMTAGAAFSIHRILGERTAARAARDVAQHERAAWLAELGRTELIGGDHLRAASYLFDAFAQAPSDRVATMVGTAMRSFDAQVARVDLRESIEAVALSPDGTRLAVATPYGLQVREVVRPVPKKLAVHGPAIQTLRWSDDGRTVYSGGADNTARAWHPDGGPPTVIEAHGHAVTMVLPAEDGTLLSAGDDGTLRRWRDDGSGTSTVVYRAPFASHLLAADRGAVHAVIVDRSTPAEPVTGVVDIAGGTFTAIRTGDAALAVISSRRLAVAQGADVSIYGAASLELVQVVHAGAQVRHLVLSPDDRYLVGGDTAGNLTLWDAATGAILAQVTAHRGPVTALTFDRDGGRLVSGGDDGIIRIWDVARIAAQTPFVGEPARAPMLAAAGDALAIPVGGGIAVRRGDHVVVVPIGAAPAVTAIALSPDARRLVVVNDGVEVWDVDNRTRLARVTASVYGATISPDGATVATREGDHVEVRDLATLASRASLRGHRDFVTSVVFTPDGRLFTGSRDTTMRAWRLDGSALAKLEVSTAIEHLAVVPEGVVGASNDGALEIWTDAGGRRTIGAHTAPIERLATTPSGDLIATAARDGALKIWKGDGDPILTSASEHAPISALAFAPDGRWLAVGDEAGEVELWDIGTGVPIVRLPRRSAEITGLRVAGDGRTVAIASYGAPTVVWEVPSDSRDVQTLGGALARGAAWVVREGRLVAFPPGAVLHRWDFRGGSAEQVFDFSGITIRPERARPSLTPPPLARNAYLSAWHTLEPRPDGARRPMGVRGYLDFIEAARAWPQPRPAALADEHALFAISAAAVSDKVIAAVNELTADRSDERFLWLDRLATRYVEIGRAADARRVADELVLHASPARFAEAERRRAAIAAQIGDELALPNIDAPRRTSALRAGFLAREPLFRWCVDRVVQVEPDTRGDIQLQLFVDNTGQVTDYDVTPEPGAHGLAAIAGCIGGNAYELRFEHPPYVPTARIFYPIRVAPLEAP